MIIVDRHSVAVWSGVTKLALVACHSVAVWGRSDQVNFSSPTLHGGLGAGDSTRHGVAGYFEFALGCQDGAVSSPRNVFIPRWADCA